MSMHSLTLGGESATRGQSLSCGFRKQGDCPLVADYKRVILLGTAEQMTSPRIRKPLAASGVLVLVPGESDRARIQRLCRAQTLDEAELAWFGQMLAHGLEHGAQAILLACEDLRAAVEAVTNTVPIIMVNDR